jgi:beta-galactosidase/beta-glucuronidase
MHKTNNWVPVENPLMTRWSKDVNPECPLPEYPRPQMIREKWLNLNGLWNYTICPKNREKFNGYEGKILVPFPLESALSGVKKKLNPSEKLYYMTKFTIPKDWKKKKILLHFGAVDWETIVWINQNKIGAHQGGYTPFSF